MKKLPLLTLIGAIAFPWSALAQSGPPSVLDPSAGSQGVRSDVATPPEAFKSILSDLLGNGVYAYASVAPEWTIWEPGIKTEQASILDFSGQGFTGLRFAAGVGVGKYDLALFTYSRPFDRSVERSSVVQTGGSTGMETLQVVGRLGSVLGVLGFLDNTTPLFQTISSLSVGYTREIFAGEATARTDAKMLNYGAQLLPNGRGGYNIANPTQAFTDIRAGRAYRFRTDFKDFEASIDILPLLKRPSSSGDDDIELRIGGYWSEWARPAELGNGISFTAYGRSYPVVYEAKYRTKGVLLSIGDKTPNEKLDFVLGLRVGVDDDIQTALPGLLRTSHPQFIGVQAKAAYNFRLLSARYGEVYFTPSASLDYRNFMETTRDASGNTIVSDKILDGEKIYKLYGRLSLKF